MEHFTPTIQLSQSLQASTVCTQCHLNNLEPQIQLPLALARRATERTARGKGLPKACSNSSAARGRRTKLSQVISDPLPTRPKELRPLGFQTVKAAHKFTRPSSRGGVQLWAHGRNQTRWFDNTHGTLMNTETTSGQASKLAVGPCEGSSMSFKGFFETVQVGGHSRALNGSFK